MPTDIGDGHGGIDLPDLKQPPRVIVGELGGPAWPVGPIDTGDKTKLQQASDLAGAEAAGSAFGGAIVLMAGPEAAPLSVFLGAASGGLWAVSVILNDLSKDPPKPYTTIVDIAPRESGVPHTDDPTLEKLWIVTQQAVAGLVSGSELLDAAERLGGALDAGDRSWATTHAGVAAQCRNALVVNLASIAAALYAAAPVLKSSPHDPRLSGDADVRAWINSAGMRQQIAAHLTQAGLTDVEVTRAIAWWQSNPALPAGPSRLSDRLELAGLSLYRCAQELNEAA